MRSGSRASTNRDRIRCYNCREFDHFARDYPTSREERDLEQLQQLLNIEEEEEQTGLLTYRQSSPTENGTNGENGTPAFLPLDSKICGQVINDRPSIGQFLTREQTDYIYKKIETGEIINAYTIEQEIKQEEQLNRTDDTNGETNPYCKLIVNNEEKIEPLMTQMEQWSILSNILNYIQHGRFHTMKQMLDVKAINKYKHKPDTEGGKEFRKLDFDSTPLKICEEYLDIYEGIQSEIVSATRFNENSDLSTTYLGRVDQGNNSKLKAEESFPISEHGYTSGTLLDGTECQLLLDMGASKSFMSKSFYMQCRSLYSLPKIASETQRIQVGNSQCVNVLFVIPVIIDVHGYRFEIFTLVSEIHENVGLVLGIKNVFELECVINSRDCCFKFLNRSVQIFTEKNVISKPNEKKLIKVKAPFVDEISGMAIVKILIGSTHSTLILKIKVYTK